MCMTDPRREEPTKVGGTADQAERNGSPAQHGIGQSSHLTACINPSGRKQQRLGATCEDSFV